MVHALVAVFCCLFVAPEAFETNAQASASDLDSSPGNCLIQRKKQSEASKTSLHDGGSSNKVRNSTCSQMWEGKSAYGADDDHLCDLVPLSQHWVFGGGTPPKMCLRQYSDIVSDVVRREKRWPDCAALAFLWKKLADAPVKADSSTFAPCGGEGVKKLFVDVGANIGSCTMQMLARPDVTRVAAFEPNPKNAFYLTSSVLQNPGYASKIALFNVALGESEGSHDMFMQPGNAGNTVLDAPTGASISDVQPTKAETITLDGVFFEGSQPPYIHVMKIDAQGFEVSILKGGRRLLATGAINAIKFELAPAWLLDQGTSAAELFTILETSGYTLHHFASESISEDQELPPPLAHEELANIACKENNIPPRDFIALYNPIKAGETHQVIACTEDQVKLAQVQVKVAVKQYPGKRAAHLVR